MACPARASISSEELGADSCKSVPKGFWPARLGAHGSIQSHDKKTKEFLHCSRLAAQSCDVNACTVYEAPSSHAQPLLLLVLPDALPRKRKQPSTKASANCQHTYMCQAKRDLGDRRPLKWNHRPPHQEA